MNKNQIVRVLSSPISGTFVIHVGNSETDPIYYNATETEIQAALHKLIHPPKIVDNLIRTQASESKAER